MRGRRAGLVYEPDMGEKILPHATANGKVWLASLLRQQAIKIALDNGLGDAKLGGPKRIVQLRDLEDEPPNAVLASRARRPRRVSALFAVQASLLANFDAS